MRNAIAKATDQQILFASIARATVSGMDQDDPYAWRRERLAALAQRRGGNAALGRELGYRDGAFIGQMIRGLRPITEKTVAQAEALPGAADWFATPMAAGYTPSPSLAPAPSPGEPIVRVPILANSGSMGGGSEALHEDVMVGALSLSENWVSKTVRPTRQGALRFIHGFGDSMSPTFEDGDILLVDTGVCDPQCIDGVYVLAANNRLYIKRVRCRMDGAMEVSSDNATVKTVDVLNGDNPLNVLGRVVWCWNGKKL